MTALKELSWRVQSSDTGGFDEIVVGRAERGNAVLLHAEMMDARSMFVDVAGLLIWVHVDRKGIARISNIEDDRASYARGVLSAGQRPPSAHASGRSPHE